MLKTFNILNIVIKYLWTYADIYLPDVQMR